jgi:putative nucleotidyltransferase with HDIG domain
MSPLVLDGQVRDRALRALDQLPPLSPVLTRLLATLAQEDISFAEIAKLIEKDTVLAGNVLRVVNSSLYGRRGTISSVRHAVALLGQIKLRNTVLGLSVSRLWNRVRTPAGWPLAAFNQHSVATAILADLLAQEVGVPYPEGGFAAGLFHDLGKLLVAVASCPEVDGPTHAELSAEVLERWNIPAAVQIAVRFHHAPHALDLSHVVHVSDRYANRIGISALPTVAEDTEPEAILASLGIEEDRIPRLVDEFQAEFEMLQRVA